MRFLVEYHEHGILPRGSNASFISIIPKFEWPINLGDFRPISLVGCMYKILAKILSTMLKKVLGGVMDQWQSEFFGGRHLLHRALVVNEVIEEAKKKKKKCLVLKVDYEKRMIREIGNFFCTSYKD